MKRDNIEKIYGLSPMQQGIMFESLLDEGNIFVLQFLFDIKGKLQLENIKKAYDEIVKKYAILRTNFLYDNVNAPLQYVIKNREADFQIIYLEDTADKKSQVERIRKEEKGKRWDISRQSLSRIKLLVYDGSQYVLLWSAHHILMDGWCMGILINEFFDNYNRLCKSNYIESEKEIPYSNYIDYLRNKNFEGARSFWSSYLDDFDKKCSLAERTLSLKQNQKVHNSNSFRINQNDIKKIEKMAQSRGVTMSNIFLAIWGILLQQVTQHEDILFGTVISGRDINLNHVDMMIGVFINTVPIRTNIKPNMTLNQLIFNINKNMMEINKNGYLSLNDILAETSLGSELFDCLFVYENYPVSRGIKNRESETFYLDSVKTYEENNYGFTITILPGEEYDVIFSYDKGYSNEYIHLLEIYFKKLLDEICMDNSIAIGEISILSEREKQRVLCEFNNTDVEMNNVQSVVELFEEKVELNGNCPAVSDKFRNLNYIELNRHVNQLAHKLVKCGIGPGTYVAIVADQSVELITGILAVLKAGGAYVPIDKNYPTARICFIIEDCNAEMVMFQNAEMILPGDYQYMILEDNSIYCDNDTNLGKRFQMSDAAYAIYTSGTTGKPKGMIIEHHSLSNYMMISRKYYVKSKVRIPLITNISFDMSVTPIFFALCNGGKLTTLTGDIDEVLEEVFYHDKFELVVLTPSHLQIAISLGESKCLQNMKDIIIGGEELETSLANKVREHFGHHIKLHNQYGPTETTVACCEYQYTGSETTRTVSIGKPTSNAQIYIMNNMKLCGVGIVGELCIAGAGVGRGYINCPDLNDEKFIKNPFGHGKLYRSGDLARWDINGNLEYLGRMDDQVKLRGNRVEIGEIEKIALEVEGVNATVIKVIENKAKHTSLCLYYAGDEDKNKKLQIYLRERLPEYMIPSYYVRIDQVPINSNGKMDKKKLPDPSIKFKESKKAKTPQNSIEKAIIDLMSKIFGSGQIDVDDKFMEIGGDSLKALTYVQKIFKVLNVKVALKDVFIYQSAREMAEYIQTLKKEQFYDIKKAEVKKYYTASFAQRRIYVLNRYENIGLTYNIPYVLEIQGDLDREALKNALQTIIEKNESFRTSFEMVNDDVVQVICDQVEFDISYLECDDRDKDKIISKCIKAFDLSKPPLIRVSLICTVQKKYYLVCDIHHIVFDGFSLFIFIQDLIDLYHGKEVKQPKINYKDFSEWQIRKFNNNGYAKMKSFWMDEMEMIKDKKQLYSDFKRVNKVDFAGNRIAIQISDNIYEFIKYIDGKGTTMAITLFSLFNVLLYKYFGESTIVVGMPVTGRMHTDLEDVIGLFMNTVPICTKIKSDETLSELLEEVKTHVLDVYENQDFPMETLFNDTVAEVVRSSGLYDIMFIMQNFEVPMINLGDTDVITYPISNKTSKMDITMEAIMKEDVLHVSIEYKGNLYKLETITDLINDYKKLIDILLLDDGIQINAIELKPTMKYSVSKSINLDDIEFDF